MVASTVDPAHTVTHNGGHTLGSHLGEVIAHLAMQEPISCSCSPDLDSFTISTTYPRDHSADAGIFLPECS